ncbi:DUF397 domain-containing protein [Streptomyces albireticuli]|uniref:DUF397 domain-containing protein n=1 Tax=Streptomyces albireticuli TaxID=1940 RepID=A0A2A2CZM2_9ACTN|nr:DUF397 domain-containing protein [Streptomyces albireticuli]PAU44609.1 DUF397 domain-containing protein [Streptomyces albireticuli]
MIRHGLPSYIWRKSSYSETTGPTCIEMQLTHDGSIAVGDSKDRTRGAFIFTPHAWATFLHSIRTGTLPAQGPR